MSVEDDDLDAFDALFIGAAEDIACEQEEMNAFDAVFIEAAESVARDIDSGLFG